MKPETLTPQTITAIAQQCVGFVRAGIGMPHASGFWDIVFNTSEGWLRVVFADRPTYKAFEQQLRAACPAEAEVLRQTTGDAQERIIAANHAADVENGLSEEDADESDAFERRVLGLPDDNYSGGRYGDAGYSGCYD